MKHKIFYSIVIIFFIGLLLTACAEAEPAESASSASTQESGDKRSDALQDIQDRGVLRVAVNPGIIPMEFARDGEIVGFDIDLADAIGEELDVEIELIIYDSFEAIKSGLLSGDFNEEYDVIISAMGIEATRLENSLAVPYFLSGLTILTHVDNRDVVDLQSLSGYKVGAVEASSEAGIISKLAGVEVVSSSNYEDLVLLQESGAVDAIVLDVPVALYAAKSNDELRVVPEPFEEQWYGIYIEGGERDLFEKISEIIRKIQRNGDYDRLYAKWF